MWLKQNEDKDKINQETISLKLSIKHNLPKGAYIKYVGGRGAREEGFTNFLKRFL